jgi:hypothetical protein
LTHATLISGRVWLGGPKEPSFKRIADEFRLFLGCSALHHLWDYDLFQEKAGIGRIQACLKLPERGQTTALRLVFFPPIFNNEHRCQRENSDEEESEATSHKPGFGRKFDRIVESCQ